MVVIDATMLLLFLRPGTAVPGDKKGVAIPHSKERIEFLIQKLSKSSTKIIIPTPALSEILVRGGDKSHDLIDAINKLSVFVIEPFDSIAAVEVADMARAEIARSVSIVTQHMPK